MKRTPHPFSDQVEWTRPIRIQIGQEKNRPGPGGSIQTFRPSLEVSRSSQPDRSRNSATLVYRMSARATASLTTSSTARNRRPGSSTSPTHGTDEELALSQGHVCLAKVAPVLDPKMADQHGLALAAEEHRRWIPSAQAAF